MKDELKETKEYEHDSEEKEVATDFPKELEDRAIDRVLDDKEESLNFYDNKFKKFNYFDAIYENGAAKKNTPYGRANLRLSHAFQQVEPFVSQMMESQLGEAPYIQYQGRTISDDAAAKNITEYTQYQLENGDFLVAQNTWYRNLAKYGTAVMKVVWDVESEEYEEESQEMQIALDPVTGMPVMNPVTGQPAVSVTTRTIKRDMITFDGPRFHNVSIYDFFVPPSASSCNVQKLSWCIHRTYRDIESLLKNPNYKNKKKLKELNGECDYEDGKKQQNAEISDEAKKQQLEQNTGGKSGQKYAGKIEVLEWWGDFKYPRKNSNKDNYGDSEDAPPAEADVSDNYAEPTLIVVALPSDGEPILLRCGNNPFDFKFKPFAAANDYPIEGEFYGYGELHHIGGLIEESHALRNARLDVANMSLNKMWIVDRNSGINIRDMYSAPNKVILTNDMAGIRQIEMSGVTASSVEELARIDFDIQNTTEIINPRQDVSSVGAAFGGTATGVNFLSAKSNLRLLTKLRLIEQTYFKELAIILNKYNKQMVTNERYYRVAENNDNPYTDEKIDPSAFSSQVDFKPTSNPNKLTRDERKANLEYLLQVLAQIEKAVPGTNNFAEFLPEVYKLAGFSHPEKFIKPPVTRVMQTPDGQLVDERGNPVQVIQPEPAPGALPPQGGPQNGQF